MPDFLMKAIFLLAAMLLVFSGCTGQKATEMENKTMPQQEEKTAKPGDKVKVDYTGKLEDGSVFDSSQPGKPLEFTIGAGQVIAGFETGVLGMKEGETKTVSIPPEKAYGERNEENVAEVPKESFGADSNILRVGMPVTNSTGFNGTITAIYDKNVVVDFNHKLAGKTLIFEITLLEINS